jgi:hypothetical protein
MTQGAIAPGSPRSPLVNHIGEAFHAGDMPHPN